MAPKVTKSNNSTTVRPATVKKKPTPKKIDIAKAMMQFAEQNTGAIGKDGFQSLLKQVNKSNVIDVIKQYDKISPKKSIIAMILGETGSNDEEMESALTGKGNGKSAVRGLFTLLLDKAKDVGVDSKTIETYKKEFEKELDAQLGNNSILGQIRSLVYTDSSKLDTIMRALVQTIDNQTQLSTDEKVKISNTPATKMQAETNNVLVKRYNTALKNFNAQLKQDGWAGDVADGFSKIWNNDVGDFLGISTGNTADRVRKDLNACKKDLDALKQARQQGDAAYRAKFQEIFKVAYNPANIVAYQKAEERYIGATKAKAQEDSFKSQFSLLLNAKGLREEGTNMISPTTGGGTYIVTATKDQVFQREEKKLLDLMGEGGKALLESKYKEAGAKTNDDKFKVLQTLTKAVATKLGNDTKLACGGASYDSVQRQFDNCYKAAYGLENDIMKRVNDYNISQQKGAGVVKSATVIAIMTAVTVATGGTGTGVAAAALTAAGTAAGATAVVEVSDRFTSGAALDELRNEGLAAYVKKGSEMTDWGSVAKASLTAAGMTIMFAGQSYAVTNLCKIAGNAAGMSAEAIGYTAAGVNTAGFIGTGLGTEYLMTGEISAEGATFTVLLAVVGGAMQVLQIKQQASINERAAQYSQFDDVKLIDEYNARFNYGVKQDLDIISAELTKRGYSVNENGYYVKPESTQSAENMGTKDFATRLAEFKDADGKQLLSAKEISNFLENQRGLGENVQAKVEAILSNPEEVADIIRYKNKAAGLWRAVQEPLNSTVDTNPELFGVKPKATTTTGTKDFATRLADFKGADGKPILTSEEIANLLKNQTGLGGEPIENFQARVEAVLSNPEEVASLSGWKSKSAGVWRAIQDPLSSTVDANPELFGVKPKATTTTGTKDFATRLADFKGADGKQFLSSEEIANLLKNQTGLGGEPIENFQARVEAVLSNPEEVAQISGWKSRGAGVWRAIQDPLNSTVEANPQAFGVKPKTTTTTAPTDFATKLADIKGADGKPILTKAEATQLIKECQKGFITDGKPIPDYQAKIEAVLSNPEEVASISSYKNKTYGIWRAIQDPLNSTVDANPELFGVKPKATTTTGTKDFATRLADFKGADGKPILTSEEIANLLKNQTGLGGEPIENFQARVEAVLSNPEEVASLSGWKSKSAGVWRAIQDPLNSTVEANPQAFGVKPKAAMATPKPVSSASVTENSNWNITRQTLLNDLEGVSYDKNIVAKMIDENRAFVERLASVEAPNGEPKFFTARDINDILYNSQKGIDGKPIPNYQARIEAVLSNPEEVAQISGWKSRGAGVWRAIQDPLNSTVEANPQAFGVKPKTTTVVKQSAPSQKLPEVVDKIYGGKAEAEAVVFGNGTLADIDPQIVQNATKELSNYFGREIKPSDLQVVRNSKGAYISYFDTETNLATTFSNNGKLNGQFKVTFDAQGNIQSYDLETIYSDGKFWLR